ncbi:MAG: ABC transporter ATP-binding protein [Alphaproteobacteria bacterium]|nr:ABC transporter ATP-binding protein [Alphaproteobacteria bacterium]
MSILSIEGLTVSFSSPSGRAMALRDVDLTVGRGRTVALVGESGSGKSCLALAILRLLPETARIEARRMHFHPQAETEALDLLALPARGRRLAALRGGSIGLVLQEPSAALSPVHTIGQQIASTHRRHLRSSGAEARQATLALLAELGFPDPETAFSSYAFELSGGLRQRAILAAALIARPALLIADEPTTALDVIRQAQILRLLHTEGRRRAESCLFITHDLGVVAAIADDVVVLHRGEVVETGPAAEVLADPQHSHTKTLIAAVPRLNGPRLHRLAVPEAGTRALPAGEARAPGRPGTMLLRLEEVTRRFPPRRREGAPAFLPGVERVSLALAEGECLALVGESGCGKSTLARLALGALACETGRVRFRTDGYGGADGLADIATLGPGGRKAFRRQAQLVFQDPYGSLNPRRTVLDTLTEPLRIHRDGAPHVWRTRAEEMLALVGLPGDVLARYPHAFSGGQRQRIAIGRALMIRPRLLVLDEPVSALDVSVQAQILNLLQDLRAVLGLSLLFITHDMAVARFMADRIAVMREGRIVELAPTERLLAHPVHPYTQRLLAFVPDPDPARAIDLLALAPRLDETAAGWPEPFQAAGGLAPDLIEIAPGHFVAMQPVAREMGALA